ncbi:MAG: hypothetical protein HON90_07815 [Halobacteriovoraceae bacterium]|jgi:hypothetical protein|nr:hypothetical protein [Halobacteriovoraceae bacterium]
MFFAILKVLIAAILISFVSWLSAKKTVLAGFLTALPLTTLLALAFGQLEWQNNSASVEFAKSIFVAIPVSLLFFIPFLFAQKLNLSFWSCYLSGIVLLLIGYYLHSFVMKFF